jgi:undecaprenyl-diphosphatase
MNIIDVIILSLTQGFSELFPVSSLGHTIIIQSLLNVSVTKDTTEFLPFIIALHLGTAIALIIYFKEEWTKIIKALFKSAYKGRIDNKAFEEKFSWMLVIGTVPVGIVGIIFANVIKNLFSSPVPASIFLIINGIILMSGEKIKKTEENRVALKNLSFKNAFTTGASQIFALLPGISRSGISMVSGLLLKLNHEDAAYFSFMLATPVILAAAVLEIPSLFKSSSQILDYSIFGAILSGITAYLSVRFLMKYFKQGTLIPYSYYSIIAGLIDLIYFH